MIRNFDSYIYKKKNELINQYSSRIIHELSRGREIKETVVEFFLNFVDENIFSEAVAGNPPVTGNQQGQPQKKIFIGGHQKDIIEIIRSTIGSLKDAYSRNIGKNPKATNLANTYMMFANNVGKKLIDAVPDILMTAAQNVSKIIEQPKPAAQAAAPAGGTPATGTPAAGQAAAGTPAATPQDLSALESILSSKAGRPAFAAMSQEEKNTLATALAGLTQEEKDGLNKIKKYNLKLQFLRKTAAERAAHMSRPPGPSRNRRRQSTATTINPPQSAPQPQSTPINPAPNAPNSAFGSRITFQPGMFQTSSYNPMKKGFLNFFESRQARNFINETAREFINNSNNVEKLVEEFIQYTKHGSKHSIILETFENVPDDATPRARRAAQQQPATPEQPQANKNTPSAPATNNTNDDIGVSDKYISGKSIDYLIAEFNDDKELLTKVVNRKIKLSGGLDKFLTNSDNVDYIIIHHDKFTSPIITPEIAKKLLGNEKLDVIGSVRNKLRQISKENNTDISDKHISRKSIDYLIAEFKDDKELLTKVVNRKIELSGGLDKFLTNSDNVDYITMYHDNFTSPIITPEIAKKLLGNEKLDVIGSVRNKLRQISKITQAQSKTTTSQPTTAPQAPSGSPTSPASESPASSASSASGSPPAASGFQYGRTTLFGDENLQKTQFTNIGKQVVLNLTKVFNKKIQEMPALDDKRIFSKIFNQVIKSVENQLRTDLQSTVKELEGKAVGSKDQKYGEVIKGNRKKNFNMIMRGLGYSNPEQFLENLGRQMSEGNLATLTREVEKLRTKLAEPKYEHNKKLIEEFLQDALNSFDPDEFENARKSNSIEGIKNFFKYGAGTLLFLYVKGGELATKYGPSIKSGLMTAAKKLGQAHEYIWDTVADATIGAGEWLSKMSEKAGDWASRMAETTGLWVIRSQLEFEEALRIFNEAKKQGQTKIMEKISAAMKAAEQAGGAFGQWVAQKRKEQLERMYASDKKNRNTWDKDSMWYDPDAPKPEPKKPSWISRKASSAKDWLKGHFTRPVEEENPQDYVWSGQGKFDNF
jgi:hypothetical protein